MKTSAVWPKRWHARGDGDAIDDCHRLTGLRSYAATALCVLAIWPAAAHHGGDVEWQDKTAGPITGTATKFAFQFPHVFFEMNVEQGGSTAAWTITTRWTPTICAITVGAASRSKPGDNDQRHVLAARREADRGADADDRGQRQALPLSF